MKNLFISSLILIAATSAQAQGKKVTLLADPWCPYTCDAGSAKPGFMIEIAKAALKGYDIDYQIVAWARALNEVRAGKHNGAVGTTETDKEGMTFSPTMGSSASCFYAKPSTNWKWDGAKSLESVTFGAVAGYTYEEAIDAYIESNKSNTAKVQLVSGDNPLPQNLKKLEADRIKVFIEDKNVVEYHYASQGQKNPFVEKGCLEATDLYIGFGAKNPMTKELVKALEDGMKALKASGEEKKILEKYGMK